MKKEWFFYPTKININWSWNKYAYSYTFSLLFFFVLWSYFTTHFMSFCHRSRFCLSFLLLLRLPFVFSPACHSYLITLIYSHNETFISTPNSTEAKANTGYKPIYFAVCIHFQVNPISRLNESKKKPITQTLLRKMTTVTISKIFGIIFSKAGWWYSLKQIAFCLTIEAKITS